MDDNHQFSDEDEDDIQLFYPLEIETLFYPTEIETKIGESSKPFRVSPSEDVAATGSETQQLPELEQPNLPISTEAEVINLPVETETNTDEPVEKDKDQMDMEGKETEAETDLPAMQREETTEMRQEEMESGEKQIISEEKGNENLPAEEVEEELPNSVELADISQEDSQLPAETADDTVSKQDPMQSVRRSERQRKPTGKFTYPQLGNPFVSFVQTVFDGFNRAIVETFEGNVLKPEHEGTHVS